MRLARVRRRWASRNKRRTTRLFKYIQLISIGRQQWLPRRVIVPVRYSPTDRQTDRPADRPTDRQCVPAFAFHGILRDDNPLNNGTLNLVLCYLSRVRDVRTSYVRESTSNIGHWSMKICYDRNREKIWLESLERACFFFRKNNYTMMGKGILFLDSVSDDKLNENFPSLVVK